MTVPPCDHCGQPSAHSEPSVKRGVSKVIVLAVLGGVVAQILFVMIAAYTYSGLSQPRTIHRSLGGPIVVRGHRGGPMRPALRACTLFKRWEAHGRSNMGLLDQAIAEAQASRVNVLLKSRLPTDLSGLRDGLREAPVAHSRMTAANYEHAVEHAVQADCAPTLAAWHHFAQRHHKRS
jgi:hypothetical protein